MTSGGSAFSLPGPRPRSRTSARGARCGDSFARQYFRYARGDGKADLWRRRDQARYGAYGLLLAALLACRRAAWLWPPLIAGGLLYVRRPVIRAPKLADRAPAECAAAIGLVPLLRLTGDVEMLGYPVGWWWRLEHKRF